MTDKPTDMDLGLIGPDQASGGPADRDDDAVAAAQRPWRYAGML